MYLSRNICGLIFRHEGRPYTSIKKNGIGIRAQGSRAWSEMLVLCRRNKKVHLKRVREDELGRDSDGRGECEVQSHGLLEKRERRNEVRLKAITYDLTIIVRLQAGFR